MNIPISSKFTDLRWTLQSAVRYGNSVTSAGQGPYWHLAHYNGIIMGAIAFKITSLMIVYSIIYSYADQRKHQNSASMAFVRGIHRGPVNFPHKWPVTRKMFPFDDVIMHTDLIATFPNVPSRFRDLHWPVTLIRLKHITKSACIPMPLLSIHFYFTSKYIQCHKISSLGQDTKWQNRGSKMPTHTTHRGFALSSGGHFFFFTMGIYLFSFWTNKQMLALIR